MFETNDVILDPLFRDKKGNIVDPPVIEGMVADTHAHLDMLDSPELALAKSAVYNVMFICSIVDPAENATMTYDMLAEWLAGASSLLDSWGSNQTLPTCRVAAGVHPHNASKWDDNMKNTVIACAKHPATVAIGEIGLDYHYDFSPRDVQQEVFKHQINVACELDMPMILHIREAHDDALKILKTEGIPKAGALLHCFTSDVDTLRPFLDLGCYVAFGGAVTFNNSDDVRKAACEVPIDKLVTETDSPYMAPVPLRGSKCSPEYVIFVADFLADTRGVASLDREEFFSRTFQNALDFYRVEFV